MSAATGPEILAPLDDEQRRVVLHRGRPMLVVAGPGSGKTRALTHRLAYLMASGEAAPQEILALAFTNKAAEEMAERLQALCPEAAGEVWVCTFHALCLRLLREHGAVVGLPRHFVVFDEAAQEEALVTALGEQGWYRYSTVYELETLRSFITGRKNRLPAPPPSQGPAATWWEIAQRYGEILHGYGALDFDDLILRALELLSDAHDVRVDLQRRWPYVFVDEYHDISETQYALLRLLAPPPGSHCTVVADRDQSIYGWRGAQPGLVIRFQEDYRPEVVTLRRNYRSAGPLVAGTQAVISQAADRPLRPSAVVAGPAGGAPAEHHLFRDVAAEAEWVAATLGQLAAAGYTPGEVAILYRTHRRGDPIEQALAAKGVVFQRVQRGGLLHRPGSQEVFRYLQLTRSLVDPHFRVAINYPRVIADELTMLQLQGLTRREGVSLVELAQGIERYPEVSPLTRAAIRRFVRAFRQELAPLQSQPAAAVIPELFRILERWRSPYRTEDRPTLVGFAQFLDQSGPAAELRKALDEGRPLALRASPDLDALAGAFLLQDAVRTYLGKRLALALRQADGLPGVWVEQIPSEAAEQPPLLLHLQVRDAGSIRYGLATQAWRLTQSLLGSFETLDQERFVVYDLETTGLSRRYDEVVEIAAVTL
ncbi:MAG: UvrD-helicase domain-containing protein, partial [Chloroflexi bacterium]|nr:UvrD-helicase domain-containing protein [Chloroflexota bacterium]